MIGVKLSQGSRQVLRGIRLRRVLSRGGVVLLISDGLDAGEDRTRVRILAARRIEALDARIAELKAARDVLKKLAAECGEGSAGPCPILSSFGV